MSFAEVRWTPQLLMELALGKVKNCPFPDGEIKALKRDGRGDEEERDQRVTSERRPSRHPNRLPLPGRTAPSGGGDRGVVGVVRERVQARTGSPHATVASTVCREEKVAGPGPGEPSGVAGRKGSGAGSLEAELLVGGRIVRRMCEDYE